MGYIRGRSELSRAYPPKSKAAGEGDSALSACQVSNLVPVSRSPNFETVRGELRTHANTLLKPPFPPSPLTFFLFFTQVLSDDSTHS